MLFLKLKIGKKDSLNSVFKTAYNQKNNRSTPEYNTLPSVSFFLFLFSRFSVIKRIPQITFICQTEVILSHFL